MRVVGVGQCSLDYLAVVDSYPAVDTKKEVLEWHEQCGGPVATALVTLSRLGIPCTFFGITGDDHAGEKIVLSLKNEGIDTDGLLKRRNATSQLAFIAIEREAAKRTIFWKRPSGAALKREELGPDFLEDTAFLLLDGLMRDASLYAAMKARELNIPVMLDAGRERPGILDIAQLSDYLIASEEFAEDLGWGIDHEALNKEKERFGVKALTITLGERGSITVSDDKLIQIPAFRVKAIDTTGAGDVFHGGYAYGLLKRWNLEDTIRFASAVAAIKCTKIGGRAGIPLFSEVKHFLSEKGYSVTPDL